MADISIQKGRSSLTWVWAVAALAATLGLMIWLYVQTPESTSAVAGTNADTATAPAEPAAEPVELAAVGAAPATFMGRSLQVSNLPVTLPLGQRTFLADIPGGSPMLVFAGPAVADVSWLREGGSVTTAVGTVEAVGEGLLNQWVASGAMVPDGPQMASFYTHYLSVTEVQQGAAAGATAPAATPPSTTTP